VLNIIQKYDGFRVPDYENVCEQLENDHYLLAIVKVQFKIIFNNFFSFWPEEIEVTIKFTMKFLKV